MLSLCPIVSDSNFYYVIKIVTVRLLHILLNVSIVLAQFDSVTQSCSTLRPHGLQHARLPYHELLELAQTHVHQVGDATQPSDPLLFPSPPAFNLSQH